MTPRERMIATLNHVQPDRVPIRINARHEVMEALRRHYRVKKDGQVRAILGAEEERGVEVTTRWGDFERRLAGQSRHYRDRTDVIWLDERTYESCWGVIHRIDSEDKYSEWAGGPFVDCDDIDSFPWPEAGDVVADGLAEQVAAFKADGYWVKAAGGVHPFKQAWHMRGFENFLCDYVASPAWVEAIYERLVGYDVAVCRALAAAGVDQIEFWGDVAMQDRMIVPPERWRALDKPVWRRIIAETRAVNPDVKFFFHSDGDVRPIIPDVIEVGFDILNPLQPECVNPAELKKQWGDRLVLDGGGSVQRTLPRGTVEDVWAEVDFLMCSCAYDGGYVFRASNVISFDCPVENVVAFFETARDYDLSTVTGPPEHIPDPPCRAIG